MATVSPDMGAGEARADPTAPVSGGAAKAQVDREAQRPSVDDTLAQPDLLLSAPVAERMSADPQTAAAQGGAAPDGRGGGPATADEDLLLSHTTQEAIANQVASTYLAVSGRLRCRGRGAWWARGDRASTLLLLVLDAWLISRRIRILQVLAFVSACRSAAVRASVKKAAKPILIAAAAQYAILMALLLPVNALLRAVAFLTASKSLAFSAHQVVASSLAIYPLVCILLTKYGEAVAAAGAPGWLLPPLTTNHLHTPWSPASSLQKVVVRLFLCVTRGGGPAAGSPDGQEQANTEARPQAEVHCERLGLRSGGLPVSRPLMLLYACTCPVQQLTVFVCMSCVAAGAPPLLHILIFAPFRTPSRAW
jgi:hypothetical protein